MSSARTPVGPNSDRSRSTASGSSGLGRGLALGIVVPPPLPLPPLPPLLPLPLPLPPRPVGPLLGRLSAARASADALSARPIVCVSCSADPPLATKHAAPAEVISDK